MRTASLLFGAAAALAAPAALAEAPGPAQTPPFAAPDAGRFSMTPAERGFLRLDKETGTVAFCAVENGAAVCRLGADERAALESEVARLRQENAELKARIAGAPGLSDKPAATPSEEEFERALSFTERFLRRIMRIFREEAPPGSPS